MGLGITVPVEQVTITPPNPFGVLGQEVVTDAGVVYVPLRAIADGDMACDVVFTLRRAEGMSDEELERDAAAVGHDLELLKHLMETPPPGASE